MAKILIATNGLKGQMFTSLAVGKRLQRENHEIFFASPSECGAWAAANELPYLQLPRFVGDSSLQPDNPTNSRGRLAAIMNVARNYLSRTARKKACVEKLKIPEIKSRLGECKPDLVICDCELHELILSAFSMRLPTMLLSPWFSLSECQESPPLNSLDVGKTNADFSEDWEELKRTKRSIELRQYLRNGFVSRKTALKSVAAKMGFPIENWGEYLWPQPFVYRSLPTIATVMQELEFSSQNPDHMFYVGPVIDKQRRSPASEQKQFDLSFLTDQKKLGKTIILVTITTMDGEQELFLNTLNNAAKANPNWLIIVAPSRELPPASKDAPNLLAFPWIPQLEVLKLTDLSVNHGGINTINECIVNEVPMLIYSGGKHDQNGCTARAQHHGIALQGSNVSAIEHEIRRALENHTMHQRIAQIHHTAIRYQQSKKLENVVAEFIADKNNQESMWFHFKGRS